LKNCSEHQVDLKENCKYTPPAVNSSKPKHDKVCADNTTSCIPDTKNDTESKNSTNATNATNATSLIQVRNASNGSNATNVTEVTTPVTTKAVDAALEGEEETSNKTVSITDNRETEMQKQKASEEEKTFFLPPVKKANKTVSNWKEPFPDRIGDLVNGTWVIPNVTSTSNVTFAKVNVTASASKKSNETTEVSSQANETESATAANVSSNATASNASASSNASVSASTLIQLSEDNSTAASKKSMGPGGRPMYVTGSYYDGEGGYWPAPGESNTTVKNELPDAEGASTPAVNQSEVVAAVPSNSSSV
jgi:hypothetical protein